VCYRLGPLAFRPPQRFVVTEAKARRLALPRDDVWIVLQVFVGLGFPLRPAMDKFVEQSPSLRASLSIRSFDLIHDNKIVRMIFATSIILVPHHYFIKFTDHLIDCPYHHILGHPFKLTLSEILFGCLHAEYAVWLSGCKKQYIVRIFVASIGTHVQNKRIPSLRLVGA
jgi:hypothetical protein